jgi:hypothetical protein
MMPWASWRGATWMIERSDFDPQWELRWRRAHVEFEALPAGTSEEVRRAALQEIYRAHNARFRTTAELADFQSTLLRQQALKLGFHLAMRPLPPSACDADWEAAWRSARAQLEAVARQAKRGPLAQPAGLHAFESIPPIGVARQIAPVVETLPSGRRQQWTALIERGDKAADVCLIQTERWRGPFEGFAELATTVYRRFFAPRLWRAKGGLRPAQVRFYSYVPWGMHVTGAEMFHARDLTWTRGRYVEDFQRLYGFEAVPPTVAAFDPGFDNPHLLIPVADPGAD